MAKRPVLIAVGLVLLAAGLGVDVLWRSEAAPGSFRRRPGIAAACKG